MTEWLRFIDKADYYVSKFLKETEEVGIALPVSLETLKEMEWNDRIALMQKGGTVGIKSTIMFADFPLDRLTGLSAKAVEVLTKKFPSRLYDMGGARVIHGKMEFHTGFSYDIDAPLGEIAEALIGMYADLPVSVPMIGCKPDQVKRVRYPLPIFRDLSEGTEYRPFDLSGSCDLILKQRKFNPKRRPRVEGQCEPAPFEGDPTTLEEFAGDIESVVIVDLTSSVSSATV